MKPSVFSVHWYRVADLHPRIRGHVQIERHCYRGEVWHVIKDPITGRQHRVNEIAYPVVGRLDGRLSVQQIWDAVLRELGDAAPSQPEVIAILSQLYDAELIAAESTPNVADVFEKQLRRSRAQRSQRMNPLAFRVALFDPTALLEALAPLGMLLMRRWAMLAWLLCVALGVLTVATHWRELGAYGALHLTTPRMLLLMWICYPLIKAVHEFAHALAVRVWGGEVHEMGVTLLVLMPVPYVDASAASGLRSKGRRIAVSLVGIAAELLMAAVAAWVWVNASDGVVREAAFATMLIGGVSTVLFNGNPLMRFDAYYALADALEIPGLARRANALLAWVGQRYLLGAKDAAAPASSRGERPWLVAYGLAAGVYRWVVSIAIVMWLAHLSLALGIAATIWIGWSMVLQPVARLVRHLLRSPSLDASRQRAIVAVCASVAVLVVAMFVVPVPLSTRAQGVVWVPDEARIRAQADGFVEAVLARDGEPVRPGQPIVQLREPQLLAEWVKTRKRLGALDAAYQVALGHSAAEARRVGEEIAKTRADLAVQADKLARLTVRSAVAGTLSLPRSQDLPGAYFAKGALVAHAIADPTVRIRVALPQADVGLVRARTRAVEVRLTESAHRILPARLSTEVPAATRDLPSAALGDRAGGPFPTDPADQDGVRSVEPVFLVDLEVDSQALERIGGRVWVRFDHGTEPIALQFARRVQQVFLRLLGGDRGEPREGQPGESAERGRNT